MILVTGGLGFVGSHTTRALLDAGESCVLVQRRAPVLPEDLAGESGRRVFREKTDVTDLDALLDIGVRHKITGIVHLAGSVPWPPGADEPVPGARKAIGSLLNVVQAAADWQVRRVGVASTIGVYGGVEAEGLLSEDTPLPMAAFHAIPPWGPGGNPASPFSAVPQLVHAAARGTSPDFSALRAPAYADDGIDMCYVKDCARAIALLQLAPRLHHRTYNIAAGQALTNREVAAAVKALVPDARIELPSRAAAPGSRTCLDIGRLRADTGYEPAYGTEAAVADYIAWLRAGHER
jgi:UDP-glucose 4-epimerase